MSVTEGIEFQHRLADGAVLPIHEWGEPIEGVRPVIGLGGISTRPKDWGELPAYLGRHFIAIGIPEGNDHPDLPSIGRYATCMGDAATDIVRERYDLPDEMPVEVDELAWSWGGLPAQKLAFRSLISELKVRRMALMATIPAGIPPVPWFPHMRNIKAAMAIMGHDRNGHHPADIYGGDYWDDEAVMERFGQILNREIDSESHRRQVIAAFKEMMSGVLIMQTVGTRWFFLGPDALVMLGDDDPVIPFEGAWNLAIGARMKPHSVHNGGHLFPAADPEGTAKAVNDFFGTVPELTKERAAARLALHGT